MLKYTSSRCMNRTMAKNGDTICIRRSIVVKAKMGAGTPVAVELVDVVAFGLSGIKETKIAFVLHHVFKLEIRNYLLRIHPLRQKLLNEKIMLVGMCIEPLGVSHKGIIAKKLGEIL